MLTHGQLMSQVHLPEVPAYAHITGPAGWQGKHGAYEIALQALCTVVCTANMHMPVIVPWWLISYSQTCSMNAVSLSSTAGQVLVH